MIFKKLRKARAGVETGAEELHSLAQTISEATAEARRERRELEILKSAYRDLAGQLTIMVNEAGLMYHKDAEGRYLFATRSFCELVWRDHICDVFGSTNEELVCRFAARFPGSNVAFCGKRGDISDVFTKKAKRKCKFIEIGAVYKRGEKRQPPFILETEKTPIFKDGVYSGCVGLSRQLDSRKFLQSLKSMKKKGVASSLGAGVFVLTDRRK